MRKSLLALLIIVLPLPSLAGYQIQKASFSVEGIYQSLVGNYSLKPGCNKSDFKGMARAVFNYLQANGRGSSYAPMDCEGLKVEFTNTGNPDALDVYVKGVK